MEPAPEVRDLYRRYLEALSSGDLSSVSGTLSRDPGVIEIGSAPDAWSEGYETIVKRLTEVSKEIAGTTITPGEAKAFQEGSIAWVADRPTMTSPEGMKLSSRITLVFRRESDGWKVVQA